MHFLFPTNKLLIAPFGSEDNDEDKPPQPPQPPPEQPENATTTPSGDGDNSSGDDDSDDEYSGYSAKELRRIARDLSSSKKTAEKDRDSLKSKVDESERAKRTDLENLTNDNEKLKSENAALKALNAKLSILGAIRDDSRFSWHNPEIVAQQLNSEVVKVLPDGKVEGLANELKRVAKDHAYLLKENPQQPPQPPTGFQPGQGGAWSSGNIPQNVKDLAEKYPALASRL